MQDQAPGPSDDGLELWLRALETRDGRILAAAIERALRRAGHDTAAYIFIDAVLSFPRSDEGTFGPRVMSLDAAWHDRMQAIVGGLDPENEPPWPEVSCPVPQAIPAWADEGFVTWVKSGSLRRWLLEQRPRDDLNAVFEAMPPIEAWLFASAGFAEYEVRARALVLAASRAHVSDLLETAQRIFAALGAVADAPIATAATGSQAE